jgi:hypothetical protein
MPADAPPLPSVRVTYRNSGLPKVLLGTGVALALLSWLVGSWLATSLIMGLWVVVSVSSYRLRVVADDDGVRVVNYFSTSTLLWTEISRVDDDGNMNGGPLCRFELRTGGRVRAWGLYGGQYGLGADYIQSTITDLERRRKEHPGPHHPHNPTRAQRGAARQGQSDPRNVAQWLGFLLGGVALIIFGLYLMNNALAFNRFGVPANGTVVSVSGFREPAITVTYVVGNVVITSTADEWLGVPRVGSHVAIVYDRRDPTRVTDAAVAGTTGAFVEAFGIIAVGLIAIVGILFLRRYINRKTLEV